MKLFDIVEGKVVINADELSIPVFKKIYDSDKTKDKQVAFNKISYIVFMYKWDSPYAVYLDDTYRDKIIKKDIFGDEKYKLDDLTIEAISRYKDFTNSLSIQFLQNNINNIKKIMLFNDMVNWDDTDKMGKLLYSVKDLQNNTEKAGSTLKSLVSLMEQVKKEELQISKTRGGNEVNLYEDTHSMNAIQQ